MRGSQMLWVGRRTCTNAPGQRLPRRRLIAPIAGKELQPGATSENQPLPILMAGDMSMTFFTVFIFKTLPSADFGL